MKKIYLLIGCPGSGKTWIANQVADIIHLQPDDYLQEKDPKKAYLLDIADCARRGFMPPLAEVPFSISEIKNPLEKDGFEIECVFIQETDDTIRKRYFDREGKDILQGHLTRQKTFLKRAHEYRAFFGTSNEVLEYLKKK